MKAIVIDGQGGGMGRMIVEALKKELPHLEIVALGTNALATANMLKGGADQGATGENPIVYNCPQADVIIGPLAIVVANSLLGEITPAMAKAVGESRATRILLPVDRCQNVVVGVVPRSFSEYIQMAVDEVKRIVEASEA
ncbi:MAG TPA: DUF3842 family protein [Firmicutes bacterium]|nr:MAG: hypothetical protein AA931_08760 [Peptococcaceae bacterium 1109]HHT72283.1 DUF3842 family protein [Bacillota bacterium]